MRKITLLLAIFALAAMPSTAAAARKARKSAAARPATVNPVNPNEASARFVRDAVPVFLPSLLIPFYLNTQTQGPHAYWYRQQQQQAYKGRRVRHAKR